MPGMKPEKTASLEDKIKWVMTQGRRQTWSPYEMHQDIYKADLVLSHSPISVPDIKRVMVDIGQISS